MSDNVIETLEIVTQGPQGPAWPSAGVQAASEAARDAAQASEAAAAASETAAATSEANAAASEAVASTKASEALASATAAATSESNAATSASTAAQKATEALGSAAAALASQNLSAASEAAALASQNAAAASESASATSETAAAASEAVALTKASEASTSAAAALASQNAAATSQAAASSSETAAANSETNAATSAANAATSEANASTSESNAAASATAAAASQSASASSQSAAATSASNASTSESNAASSATAALTSANNASTSETNAAASATAAASSATAALLSQNAAALSEANALTSAATSSGKANESSGYTSQALAIYGSASALQSAINEAESFANQSKQYAESAASVVQQDLSGATSKVLHQGPYAIGSLFIYDTSRDSDGGAWTQKCQHTSWYNENLSGNWLGQHSDEFYARQVRNAIEGNELVVNGTFDTDTSGWYSQNTPLSVRDGKLIVSFTNNAAFYNTTGIPTVNGQFYVVRFEWERRSIQSLGVEVRSGSDSGTVLGSLGGYTEADGIREFYFFGNGSNVFIRFTIITPSLTSPEQAFDNISLKTLTPTSKSNDYFRSTANSRFYRLYKNVVQNSEDYYKWVSSGNVVGSHCSISNTKVDSPLGVGTANTLTHTSTGNSSYYGKGYFTNSLNKVWSVSIYAKAGDNNVSKNLRFYEIGSSGGRAVFDLSNGTVSSTYNLISAAIYPVDGWPGWYRCHAVSTHRTGSWYSTWGIENGTAGDIVDITGHQIEYGTEMTDYEFKDSDGATAEVYRGNKKEFPRLSAIVAQSAGSNTSQLVIYDLTEKDFPMWMSFPDFTSRTPTNQKLLDWYSDDGGVASFSIMNGWLVSPNNTNGLMVHFIKDWIAARNNLTFTLNTVADRLYVGESVSSAEPTFIQAQTNSGRSASMLVEDDAVVEPTTGLPKPSVVVGSVKPTYNNSRGQSFSYLDSSNYDDVVFMRGIIGARRGFNTQSNIFYYTLNPGKTNATTGTITGNFAKQRHTTKLIGRNIFEFMRASYGTPLVQSLKFNSHNISQHITSSIGEHFNTGYEIAPNKRSYLSSSFVGSINSSQEIAVNGTNFIDSDLDGIPDGWSTNTGASIELVDGRIKITGTSYSGVAYSPVFQTSPGKFYKVVLNDRIGNPSYMNVLGETQAYTANWQLDYSYTNTFKFVATATSHRIGLSPYSNSGGNFHFGELSIKEIDNDHSTSDSELFTTGVVSTSQVAENADLVGYSGFSASNYLREPYSSSLDLATSAWSCSAWIRTKYAAPGNLTLNSDRFTAFTGGAGYTRQTDLVTAPDGNQYDIKFLRTASSGNEDSGVIYMVGHRSPGVTVSFYIQDIGVNKRLYVYSNATTPYPSWSSYFDFSTKTFTNTGSGKISTSYEELPNNWYRMSYHIITGISSYFKLKYENTEIGDALHLFGHQVEYMPVASDYKSTTNSFAIEEAVIFERGHSTGAFIRLSYDSDRNLIATVNDGANQTTATTFLSNNDSWNKVEVSYQKSGSLSISMNGAETSTTHNSPLSSLNNSNAVLTVGNNYSADSPFNGSIALLKISSSCPSYEQSSWMYREEKKMFDDNVKCTLPDSTSIRDLSFDDTTNNWFSVSYNYLTKWTGLIRNDVLAVPENYSFRLVKSKSGITITSRDRTSPNTYIAEITMPSANLRNELVNRAEHAARMTLSETVFDFAGGFTATTTAGSTSLTSASGITYPDTLIGSEISGSGIPSNTTITSVSGTTIYISNAATDSNVNTQILLSDFQLPCGYTATEVYLSGIKKQEGESKDWIRYFDGFKEIITFNTAPAHDAWLQIVAKRLPLNS